MQRNGMHRSVCTVLVAVACLQVAASINGECLQVAASINGEVLLLSSLEIRSLLSMYELFKCFILE